MNSPKEVGEIIKKLRNKNNMSQKELGDKLYVGKSAISRWETGTGYPDISSLNSLSKIFNVSIDYLLNSKEIEEYILNQKEEKYFRSIHFKFLLIQLLLIGDLLFIWFANYAFFGHPFGIIYISNIPIFQILKILFYFIGIVILILFEYFLWNFYYKKKNNYKIVTIILFVLIILISVYVVIV